MAAESLVVVGGGLAAARAVEAIRAGGHDGPLVLVGKEASLPYDRPPLSKGVLAGAATVDSAMLHPPQWYAEREVDLRLGVAAVRLDPQRHTLTLADSTELAWDRLLLATGSTPRRLDVPGAELDNVLYLRTDVDSTTLRARLESGRPVVIVGAGWIGLEVAAAARGHGCEVTVVEPQSTPLKGVLGEQVGTRFADVHRGHGVSFRFGAGVDRLVGDTAVSAVVTTTGETIPAETVVVGVGITPDTRLAAEAGLEVDNGIVCDSALRTSHPEVFGAGDAASWFNPILQQRLRVEHWANAHSSGFAAGRSMLGEAVVHDELPYFFSDQYDFGLEYVGHTAPGDPVDVVVRPGPTDDAYLALWVAQGRVVAGMHVNMWETIDDLRGLVRSGQAVDPRRLADPSLPLLNGG